jgi:hypothetical protein
MSEKIIAIQWIDRVRKEASDIPNYVVERVSESSEGRFVIWRHKKGFYILDRIGSDHAKPCASVTQPLETEADVLETVDLCKIWAHKRLERYWTPSKKRGL